MTFRRGVDLVFCARSPEIGVFRRYTRHKAGILLLSRYSATLPMRARCWVKIQFARITRDNRCLALARIQPTGGLILQHLLRRRRSLLETLDEIQSMVLACRHS